MPVPQPAYASRPCSRVRNRGRRCESDRASPTVVQVYYHIVEV